MMPGTRSKYTAQTNAKLEVAALAALVESRQALNISEIIAYDSFTFGGISTQKMARILGRLDEMGFIRKAKSKKDNRMVYKAVSVMQEEGYDVE